MLRSNLFHASDGASLAYHNVKAGQVAENLPGIVFLGGFRSDMTGTKAVFLQDWAEKQGRAFLRFDYTGHGESSGAFEDGCIGDWVRDACDIIAGVTQGPQILVGSSMGGWIALRVIQQMPERIAGLVGIAAAPDFTEDSMWDGFSEAQRVELMEKGRVELPSEYDMDMVITRRLIEDGRNQLVLRTPLALPFPVRLLHGTEDVDVAQSVPLRLIAHADAEDMRLVLVKGADHRFSDTECLALIADAITEVTERAAGPQSETAMERT